MHLERKYFILLYIGLIISPMYFISGCKDKKVEISISESIDSFPRLTPKDAVVPRSSYNPKFSIACYYSIPIQTMFYKSEKGNGSFKCPSNQELISFYPHNLDSIFLFYKDSIKTYNSDGKVLNSIHYNNKITHNNTKFSIGKLMYDFPNLSYIAKSNTLIIPCNNFEYNWWYNEFFINSMPIVGIDVNNGNYTFYDNIKYPIQYTKNCYAEQFNYSYTFKGDSEIFFSYNALPNLYSYKLKDTTEEVNIITLSKNLPYMPIYDTAYSEDLNMVMEYCKNVPSYLKIMYDPYKNIYYRFHYLPTKNAKQKAHGSFQALFDAILTIYNDKFQEIKQYNFGDAVNPYGTFVTKSGLHIKLFKPSPLYEYYKIISINSK